MVSSCFYNPLYTVRLRQLWRIVGAGTKERTKAGSFCGCYIRETIICRCCVSEVNSLTQRCEIR
jgi:hypothetical protein